MILTLTAIAPFFLLFVLMALFKKPAVVAAPITLLFTLLGAYFVWGMEPYLIVASLIRGGLITLEIIFILLGAIILVNILKQAKVFDVIENIFAKVSPDKRIQAILIGWFFVAFIEGVAGFGTPAILAAPLLVALGFAPLAAVAISLIGDSVSVTFGAAGLPILIGITQGLDTDTLSSIPGLTRKVALGAVLIQFIAGALIPLFISVITSYTHNHSIRKGLEIWPFAIISGFAFLIPFVLSAAFLPLEFPTIIASLVGGGVMIFMAKKKILTPKKPLEFIESHRRNSSFSESISITQGFKVFSPYIAILIVLLATRIPAFGLQDILKASNIPIENILGSTASYSLPTLYSQGFIFLAIGLLCLPLFKLGFKDLSNSFSQSIGKVFIPFLGLLFILGIVQIMAFSSENTKNLPGMPLYLASVLSGSGIFWPLFAPFVGAMGAFITGSSTVSNLLFASFQAETAKTYGFSIILILALQAVGSALGNMVAIHNILAAQAAVGLKHKDDKILRLTLLPAIITIGIAGIIGLILAFLI